MISAKEYYDDMNELCIIPREYDNTVIPLIDHYSEIRVNTYRKGLLDKIEKMIAPDATKELVKTIFRNYIDY